MTSHFLVELDVVRGCQVVAETSDARSRAADAERAMVAMRKELEDALAWADGLSMRLQVREAERAKVEEAVKVSAEASVAHLGKLQEAWAQLDDVF